MWFSPARLHRASPDIEKYDQSRMRGERGNENYTAAQPLFTHDRRAVVMDHQPLVADEFEEGSWQGPWLVAVRRTVEWRDSRHEYPSHVVCNLDHRVGEFELHREGVIEDQHPGITDSGPPGTDRPGRGYTGAYS